MKLKQLGHPLSEPLFSSITIAWDFLKIFIVTGIFILLFIMIPQNITEEGLFCFSVCCYLSSKNEPQKTKRRFKT